MNDKRFDEILRSKLSDLNFNSEPQWEAFQKKKAAHDSAKDDLKFDRTIRSKVLDYQHPYQPQHWTILKNRLKNIFQLHQKISMYKSLEMAAILFILVACLNGLNWKKDASSQQKLAKIEAEIIEKQMGTQGFVDKAISAVNHDYSHFNLNQITSSDQENSSSSIVKQKKAFKKEKNELPSLMKKDLEPTPKSDLVFQQKENGSNIKPDKLNALASINSKEFNIAYNKKRLTIEPVVSLNNVDKMASQHSIAIVSSLGFNNFHTQANLDPEFSISDDRSVGLGLGIQYSLRKSDIEYVVGMSYTKLKRSQDIIDNYVLPTGFYSFNFTKSIYDLISVPLKVNYHFIQTPRFSTYVSAGWQSDWVIRTSYAYENEWLGAGPITPTTNPNITLEEVPFINENNFHDGIFDGGEVYQNHLGRLSLGIGTEISITHSHSLFLSGEYFKSVVNPGLGPLKDNVNTFNLNLGFKFGL